MERALAGITLLITVATPSTLRAGQHDGPGVALLGPPPPKPPAMIARDADGRTTVRATRVSEPIVLDGRLNDSVYARVPPLTDFIQQEPHEGQPASE